MSQAAIVKDDDVVMGDPEDESSDVETNNARDCADCGEDIGNYQPFVEFMPCRHVVCCPCQLTTLTERKPYKDFLCNDCLETTKIMCYFEHSRAQPIFVEIENPQEDNALIAKDPFRHFRNKLMTDKPEQARGVAYLSYTFLKKKTDLKPSTHLAVLNREIGVLSAEAEEQLLAIMAQLNVTLVHADRRFSDCEKKLSKVASVGTSTFENFAVLDDRLLKKACVALGCGEDHTEIDLSQDRLRSKFIASVVAAEMLARANSDRAGHFQLAMATDLLSGVPVPESVMGTLSRWKVVPHPSTVRRQDRKSAAKALAKGVNPHPYGLLAITADNLGFRKKSGYLQYTIVQIANYPETVLKKIGFYEAKEEDRIPRDDGIDWQKYLKENKYNGKQIAEEVIKVRESDIEMLSNRILTHIDYVITADLPNLFQCQQIKTDHLKWDGLLLKTLGVKLKPPDNNQPTAEPKNKVGDQPNSDAKVDDDDPASVDRDSELDGMYKRNHIELDFPWVLDIAKKETVAYLHKYQKDATNPKETPLHSSGERPVQEVMNGIVCDGVPTSLWYTLRNQAKQDGDDSYDDTEMFSGGFHEYLHGHTTHGKLFHDAWGYFVHGWRRTEGQANWVLFPGDPNDVELEIIPYIAAQYRRARDSMMRLDEGPVVGYTATEVNEYMLDRAREYPVCMMILAELRYAELVLMTRDSEKSGNKGDVELFLAALRLKLVFYTVSNAYKYVQICCEMLKWWFIASSAQRILFEEFFFTKLSTNGRPIWADRCIEWSMKHLRSFLGKHATQNHNEKMDRLEHDIPVRVQRRSNLRNRFTKTKVATSHSRVPFNEATVAVSEPYVETYLRLSKANVWGPGHPNTFDDSVPPSFRAPNNDDISYSLLTSYSLGTARAEEYFIRYYVMTQFETARGDVNLSLIPGRVLTREKNLRTLHIIRLSVDDNVLKNCTKFRKEDIRKELTFLRTYYLDMEDPGKSQSRDQLVDTLCFWRKQYFEDFPDSESFIKEHLKAEAIADATSTDLQRAKELEDPYFLLSAIAKVNFDIPLPGANEVEDEFLV